MSEQRLQALMGLTPSSEGLSRDQLLFDAGRASAPSVCPWKIAVALLALTQTLTIGVVLWSVPVPKPVETPLPYRQPQRQELTEATLGYWHARGELPEKMPEVTLDPVPEKPTLNVRSEMFIP
jgi:hypothetical protein